MSECQPRNNGSANLSFVQYFSDWKKPRQIRLNLGGWFDASSLDIFDFSLRLFRCVWMLIFHSTGFEPSEIEVLHLGFLEVLHLGFLFSGLHQSGF